MKILNQILLCILVCNAIILLPAEAGVNSNCDDTEAIKIEATPTGGVNISDGTMTLLFPTNSKMSDFKIHLFAPRKENNILDVKVNTIKGLSKGKYYLIIQSVNGDCTRNISVEIK